MNKLYQADLDQSNALQCARSSSVFKTEHFHSRIEIYYALTDGIIAKVGGQSFAMKKDSFVIADSFDVHSYDGEGEFFYLIIPDRYFESYKQIRRGRVLKDKYFEDKSKAITVKKILSDVYELNSADDANFLQMEGLIKYLLGTIVSYTELIDEKSTISDDTAKEVLMYINNNFKSDLTLDKISKSLGFNKHYICHLLGKILSQSLNDYINGLRLDYFINNVDSSDNISEIAYKSGFQSLATFYRAFDKVYGCSPKKYLENKRNMIL